MGHIDPRLAVEDVFITDELARRPPTHIDSLKEKLALQDLAARMADQPEEVLPRFVDLALEITGGVSAGLSLYEPEPGPGVFRWQYLRGILAPFNGATTPRDFSPCGITLDRNAPVLSLHPERVYNWISDADIVVPEVLLVPLYIGGSEPLGTLWIVSATEGHFDGGHARAMTELASFVDIALRMLRTEQRLQQAFAEQETLALEMSHRVNNLFLVAEGMIQLSARHAADKEGLAEELSGRLCALARAHALVRPSLAPVDVDLGAFDMAELIETIVAPYETQEASRFAIEGPPIRCAEHATNALALVFHELATNAAKYGALRGACGRVEIGWRRDGETVTLRWVERGGPPVDGAPTARGFGSTLLEQTVARRLDGTLDCAWPREGLALTITIPVGQLVN